MKSNGKYSVQVIVITSQAPEVFVKLSLLSCKSNGNFWRPQQEQTPWGLLMQWWYATLLKKLDSIINETANSCLGPCVITQTYIHRHVLQHANFRPVSTRIERNLQHSSLSWNFCHAFSHICPDLASTVVVDLTPEKQDSEIRIQELPESKNHPHYHRHHDQWIERVLLSPRSVD